MIQAIVSDFGGVLTTPLLGAVRARAGGDGVADRGATARRWRTASSTTACTRCSRSSAARSARREFLARLERGPGGDARPRRVAARLRRAADGRSCEPNQELFDHFRGAARRARPALRAVHQQRARVGAAVARQAADRRACSRSSSTPRSSARASPSPRSTRSRSSGSGVPARGVRVPRRPRGQRRSGARSGYARHRVPRQRASTGRAGLTARLSSERLSGCIDAAFSVRPRRSCRSRRRR